MKRLSLFLTTCLLAAMAFSQEEIKLYPNGPAESNGLESQEKHRDKEFLMNISEPRMQAFIAPKDVANGAAVIICPGGGYVGVSYIKEGSEIARWFNERGISAFVLFYRMPNGHPEIPLKDAQTAMDIIRNRAPEWNIDTKKIGIMGFSAGGHLASTVGTHFTDEKYRPAFMILGYPVVTMKDDGSHKGSRKALLGENPSEELILRYSNELHVTAQTPPTFIYHCSDDKTVPVANSENLINAIKSFGTLATLMVYDQGGHGFGMRKRDIEADVWPFMLHEFLFEQGLAKEHPNSTIPQAVPKTK
ncbi:MAG: alpha/beta hydrolase [Bacteroidales bacterium]|jgi:acetyl esterase/lipase|nr:alpha/beta hydrolase [Bacteroidales bacterium]